MPFKSERQREWMKINKPEIYRRWKKKYGAKPKKNVSKKKAEEKNHKSGWF